MDEETKKKIKEMWTKYSDNKDVQFLLLQLSNLELKLRDADLMAMCIDIAIQKRMLDSRSLIGDARLEYGEYREYKFADKKFLSVYRAKKDI